MIILLEKLIKLKLAILILFIVILILAVIFNKVKMKAVRNMEVYATAQTDIFMPVCQRQQRISQISGQHDHR